MTTPRALAVLRELQNSPDRETDDALILRSVASELTRLGVDARVATPEEFDAAEPAEWDLLIPMCESYPRLKRLAAIARQPKPLLVNDPQAILNCYRVRMAPLLGARADLVFPPTEIRSVDRGAGDPPRAFPAPAGWWIKRGDVHNTCDHDVVRVRRWQEIQGVLRDFQAREITHYVIQPHLEGDLIKFYGVGAGTDSAAGPKPAWFTWFYHDPSQIRGLPFETEGLAASAAAAADAVGLEIYGGDAIVSEGRVVTVIDINSWPSFAKVRGGAAPQIARHLRSRLPARSGTRRNPASGRRWAAARRISR